MLTLKFAMDALNALPSLIAVGADILSFIETTNEKLKQMQAESRDPTDEEWESLNQTIEELRAQRTE